MGNKSKRPGRGMSELAVATATSAPAMLAAMVMQAGGRVLISFDALARVADEIDMNVSTIQEGMLLQTVLRPIVKPGLEVPEGPAGVADLGELTAEDWQETEEGRLYPDQEDQTPG